MASPFGYGMQYSWLLVIFATVLMFGCFIPLILPFGFVYFAYKYLVDKYNLVYVCPKIYESDERILHTALNYVIFCIILCQSAVGGFYFLKGLVTQGVTVLSVMVLSVALYCYRSYRRQTFRKKQMARMENIVENRREQTLHLGGRGTHENEEASAVLETFKGAYLHPILKEEEDQVEHGGDVQLII